MRAKDKNKKKARFNAAAKRLGRMRLFALGIALLFVFLAVKLFQLQILQGKTYAQKARSQHTCRVPLDSRRGSIVDRSGHELAVDLPQLYTLGVYPAQIHNNKALCQELAGFTHRPASHYVKRLQSPSKFVYLEWRLTEEQSDRLKALGIGGLKEKAMSAHRAGIKKFILPARNKKDLMDIPTKVRRDVEFVLVDSMEQVIEHALAPVADDLAPQ